MDWERSEFDFHAAVGHGDVAVWLGRREGDELQLFCGLCTTREKIVSLIDATSQLGQ